MRFLAVGFSTILFLLAVVGGIGVAPAVVSAAAAAPQAAALKQGTLLDVKDFKYDLEAAQWPEKYDPRTLKPIRLFMTRGEVRKMWGEPAKYSFTKVDFEKMTITGKYILRKDHDAAVRTYGPLNDEYYRKTESNRYSITIRYQDIEQEGKKTTRRISKVSFTPDKKVPLFTILRDFPEVRVLCADECEMHGIFISVSLFPTHLSKDQRSKVKEMVRLLKPIGYASLGEDADWRALVQAHFTPSAKDKDKSAREVLWMNRPVGLVTLEIGAPQEEMNKWKKRESVPGEIVVDLGFYKP